MTAPPIYTAAPQSLASKLRRGSIYVIGGRLLGIGIGCAINVFLARMLDRADFGRYSLLLVTTVIFSTAARFGFDRLLMRHLAESDIDTNRNVIVSLIRNAARVVFVTTLISAVGMAAFLSEFAPIYKSGQASLLIITTLASMVAMTVLCLIAECFRGFHDLKRATFYDPNRSGPLVCLIFLLLLAGSAATDLTLLHVMLAFLATQLLVLILAAVDFAAFLRARNHLHYDAAPAAKQSNAATHKLSALGEIKDFRAQSLAWAASSIAASQVLGNLMGFGDTWIAGATVSAVDLGKWSAVAQLMHLVSTPLAMINMTIISAIPALHRQGNLDELQRILRTNATVATIISLIPLTLLIFFPARVISIVYGPQFVDAALPLVILSFGRLVCVWTGTCGNTLMLTGHERIVLLNSVVSALIMLSLGYIAASTHGIVGLACVVSAVTIFANIANWLAVRATVGIWTHSRLRFIKSQQTT